VRGEGPGALYYTAMLALQLPAADLEAQNRGVMIERAYFLDGTQQPITQARIGDVINVRLTITVGQEIPYFALRDTLPAGLDIRLPKVNDGRTDGGFWSWGTNVFSVVDLRDDGVTLYAGTLPRGTYVYTYQAQAMTPGEFQLLPASGVAMYQPEIFGRTQGGIFAITRDD
jgi:alpha-2-macroglobulin